MKAQDIEYRIPVTLLTGFLGAGKTTLLNHLLSQPEMAKAAVLINEFGSVAVDHHLVSKIDEDLIMLDSGCICCTVRGDLTRSLTDLFMKSLHRKIVPINRVVIETTGLADPAPVIFTLMEDFFIAERFRIDGVVTAVDTTHAAGQLAQHPEAVKQVAMADRLLLSKCDLAEGPEIEQLSQTLRRINPAAAQIYVRRGEVALASITGCGLYDPGSKTPDVAGWLAEEKVREERRKAHEHHHHHHHDVDRHDAEVYSFALTFDQPLQWVCFVDAISMVLQGMGDRILRIKGLLNVIGDDKPRVVQCVQHTNYPYTRLDEWPAEAPYNDKRSRLVFIVRGIDQLLIEKAFAMFCGVLDGERREALVAEGRMK
ncbi:GTP-binding protein [Dechloromonas denitrificans]|uniref:CobW family GTP-binding protein n=1 Tax=Dechloromonas denitrificans TaxID=281362 RepID=UPI001CF84D20|nr:GTP-binding protein [Dechloromonas denitrificans]UCV12741.1 GTP-binding protein [Dechloromonas denitrificans]